MKNRFITYSLHALGWLTFLFLSYLLALPGSANLEQVFQNRHDVQMLLTMALLIVFSYVNYLVLVPRLYLTKRNVRYFGLLGIWLALIALVPVWSEPFVQHMPLQPAPAHHNQQPGNEPPDNREGPHGPPPGDFNQLKAIQAPPFFSDLSQILLLFVVSVLVSISVQVSNRLHEVEVGKLQAELGQLKAQIHPHFLFNTLNSIYALAIRKDDKTADTVVKLAEFMRYMIRDAGNDRVPLEKETTYIQNYLDLQQSRLRDSVQVLYTLTGSVVGWQIAPLILFTFIENAFKHGVNPDEPSEIRINLMVMDQTLWLTVFNRKVTVQHVEADGGLGLQNAQSRLQLLYPGQHTLLIADNPTSYTVTLTLKLI